MEHTVNSTADMLAFIPRSLGFQPEPGSIALLTIEGDGRSGGVMVTQLGDHDEMELAMDAAHKLASLQPAPEHVVIVGYLPDSDFTAGGLMAGLMLFHGINPLSLIHVKADKWIDLLDGEEGTVADIDSSVMAAELTAEGYTVGDKLPTIPEPVEMTDEEYQHDRDSVELHMSEVTPAQGISGPGYDAPRDEWEVALKRGHGPGRLQAFRLIAYFQHRNIRDRLVVDVLTHTHDSNEFGRALMGEREVPMSRSRMRAAKALVNNLLGYAHGDHRVPLLTVMGWLHWITGDSTGGAYYWDAALEISPDYRLAHQMKAYAAKVPMPPCVRIRPVA